MRSTATRPGGARRTGGSRRRRGAIVVELLFCLPVWLIGLLAIVEFAELVTRLQQVALASRVGTEVASQTTPLSTTNGNPVPTAVLNPITNQMSSAGLAWCKVYLQHNVGGGPVVTLVSGTCTVPAPPLPSPLPPGQFVRVTVYAEATQLAPNLLSTELFGGLDIATWHVRESTTMHHESE